MKAICHACVAIAAMAAVTSCDDNGAELKTSSMQVANQVKEETIEKQEVALENIEINFSAEANGSEVYSTEYDSFAEYVIYIDHVEQSRQKLGASDMQLSVSFTTPSNVYVATEAELENVTLAKSSVSSATPTTRLLEEGRIVTEYDAYGFTFDCAEYVEGKAHVEHYECGDTIFPRPQVRDVRFRGYNSVRNENLSNKDSLVNDITLMFSVDIVVDRAIRSRAVDADVDTYTAEVQYERIYKTGYVPSTDSYVKTIVKDYGESLTNSAVNVWVKTVEVWTLSGEKNEKTEKLSAPLAVNGPSVKKIYTDSSAFSTYTNGIGYANEEVATNGNFTVTTRTQGYASTASNGTTAFTNNYQLVDAKIVYVLNEARVEFPYGKFTVSEGESTVGTPSSDGDYAVYPYVNNIDYVYSRTESVKGSAKAEANIYIGKTDSYVKTIVKDYGESLTNSAVNVWVKTVEVWTQSGEKNEKTEKLSAPLAVSGPSLQRIYTDSSAFSTYTNGIGYANEEVATNGNFTVTTRTQEYASTASNGTTAFTNNYQLVDAKIVYVLNEARVEFPYGKFTVSEGESTVGTPSSDGDYAVYPYVNNIDYVYSRTESVKGSAKAEANIYIGKAAEPEQPIDKIIPESWGNIIGAGISAVPSDDLGESTNIAKKCLTIRTDKGAIPVVFDWNSTMCSVNNVVSATFTSGSYDSSYNSAYWASNVWKPAIAKDVDSGIAYYVGGSCVRNVRNTTLKMWGWANGTSTVVSGYTFSVDSNNVLTVKHNGQVVLTIR